MATCNPNQTSSDIEEYLRELLECPVCMETIKSVPVYQCTNGHVICKDCIEKLNNCPICRNDSSLVRSLELENIVQRIEGIPIENQEIFTAKRNLKKWGKGSVRVYGTINGSTQETRIELNLQANPAPLNPPANNLLLCLSRCCTVMFNEDNFRESIRGIWWLITIIVFLVFYLYYYLTKEETNWECCPDCTDELLCLKNAGPKNSMFFTSNE